MVELQNELLRASIHPRGAELTSIQHVNGLDYMWNGDAAFWGKHSPVLFPIVGSLVHDSYQIGDQFYTLPRHGFARDMTFEVTALSETEASFVLVANETTLQLYPFHFKLILHYRLEQATMHVTYKVENEGSSPLYFSIGGHPAFAVPLTPDSRYTDYFLDFDTNDPLIRWKLKDGLVSNHTDPVTLDNGRLWLHPELFYEDAIVLRNISFKTVTLGCTMHQHGLRFDCAGFKDFGIWAAKDAPFLCLEPWCGHADLTTHQQLLQQKAGIMELAPEETWERTWSVTCF